jgi:hypothetical protein
MLDPQQHAESLNCTHDLAYTAQKAMDMLQEKHTQFLHNRIVDNPLELIPVIAATGNAIKSLEKVIEGCKMLKRKDEKSFIKA